VTVPGVEERRYYMKELEQILDRDRSTIRTWEARNWLPPGLAFKRDDKDWRYWSQQQLEQAIEWLESRNPGRVEAGKRVASQ
jgi:hypothetical protein